METTAATAPTALFDRVRELRRRGAIAAARRELLVADPQELDGLVTRLADSARAALTDRSAGTAARVRRARAVADLLELDHLLAR